MEQKKKPLSVRPMAGENLAKLIEVTTEKVKDLASASSVAGDTIYLDGSAVIPVSKISAGFAGGTADLISAEKRSADGGAGGGAKVTVTPVAFVVKNEGRITIEGVPDGTQQDQSPLSGAFSGILGAGLRALAAKKAQKAEKKETTDTEKTVSEHLENGSAVIESTKTHSETKRK